METKPRGKSEKIWPEWERYCDQLDAEGWYLSLDNAEVVAEELRDKGRSTRRETILSTKGEAD